MPSPAPDKNGTGSIPPALFGAEIHRNGSTKGWAQLLLEMLFNT